MLHLNLVRWCMFVQLLRRGRSADEQARSMVCPCDLARCVVPPARDDLTSHEKCGKGCKK